MPDTDTTKTSDQTAATKTAADTKAAAGATDTTSATDTTKAADTKAADVKMVPESDLLAVKAGKEGLEKKLKEMEDSTKLKLSETENKLFSAEARLKDLEGKLSEANISAAEAAKLKLQIEAATKTITELSGTTLSYRRKIIALTYNIPVDTLEKKTLEQLDMYEEAIKAVKGSKGSDSGSGGYATGGGGGGGAQTETPHERAKRIIAEHEEKKGSLRVTGAAKK